MSVVWKNKSHFLHERFDPTYMGEEKSPNSANSYGVDSNWYADSGAMGHITGELDKLGVRETYNGKDQIYTSNRSGMHIKTLVIHNPHCDLSL
jgi:hypothetical protein